MSKEITSKCQPSSEKMSEVRRIQVSGIEDKEKELERLIELYLKRSEEVEAKEAEVLEKVEFMQSAIASIRAWNERESGTSSTPAFVDVNEIEEETQQIREETERLQEEIRQKIEDNRRLQEEIDNRKLMDGKDLDDLIKEDLKRWEEKKTFQEKMGRREIQTRSSTSKPSAPPPDLDDDPGMQFFRDKLEKLKLMEIAQRRESRDESERANLRMKKLKEKIELLEWESEFDRRLLQVLKKVQEKKKANS